MDYKNRKNTIVVLGSDHAGYEAKSHVIQFLDDMGYSYLDKGTFSEDSVDYPDYGVAVGREVAKNPSACGIVICGSGIGISISANKVKGIRAALCTSEYHAEMARRHNDANVLAMGARVTPSEEMKKIMTMWFSTEFEGGRHAARVNKIHTLTEK